MTFPDIYAAYLSDRGCRNAQPRNDDRVEREAGGSPMKGQTVLVTGGTSGIGFFTAQGLAARGARVVVTGRDAHHGLRALDRLRRAAPGADATFLDADHETVGGNQRLARRVRERYHRLDV